jgi:hypothetical protein
MASPVLHVNQVMVEPGQVIRKRHHEWASFTVPLCAYCLANCLQPLLIRYPVAAAGDEECQCPCRKEAA